MKVKPTFVALSLGEQKNTLRNGLSFTKLMLPFRDNLKTANYVFNCSIRGYKERNNEVFKDHLRVIVIKLVSFRNQFNTSKT